MQFQKKWFALSLLACAVQSVLAQTPAVDNLPAIELKGQKDLAVQPDHAAGDFTVKQKDLIEGATTIGNALEGKAGIYSAQYTGGVSRPVIRGLDGARVKITQNGGDALDVSSVSPDHAVTVDPNSAEEIQVLKGPESLLYGAGSVGGLVNVVDNKVPTRMPDNGYSGRVGARYNTGSDDMLYSGQTVIGLGDHIALSAGGMHRDANNYILPKDLQADGRRQSETFARSHDANVGLSWIGDKGFVGVAYSERHDRYGIPGDNAAYGACELNNTSTGFTADSCGHAADDDGAISSINLKQKRYDLKSELNDPFAGFSKVALQANYTKYQHQELDGDVPDTTFNSHGTDTRLVLTNTPWAGWTGQFGAQYTQQKLSIGGDESLMDPTNTQRYSVFGLQEKQMGQVHVQVSSRIDHQKIDIQQGETNPDAKNFSGTAYSVAGSADWEFVPNYKLSLTASHQERLPMAQELYSNGKHMATNTYELGSDDLGTEKSNNVELGFHFDNDRLKYNISAFHNWFNNFIYADTLDQFQDFRLVQYRQSKARFYGVDGDISYQLSPVYTVGLFGDYVRGKLVDEGNAPRVPGGRLGAKISANFDDHYSANAEYYHVFTQDDIASYETNGQSYNMLNLGFAYNHSLTSKLDYRVYTKVNNLLDSKIYQHESFLSQVPQVGRNFTVGVDFKF
ncbi:zinc piracy TonB-dependent receptor ZnuD [Acinetobacter boissieri]|uniref:Iron complex outermembrane recepter protein n=1 Tax=Acinetobacter boissieri TaxID=1219383 RepID=A0A1G6GGK5_9GAMM|nr:zinc piracy TonB-dependent receptor ZnuD [Acinetobacter boissieri]SDB80875.1 iron complex outermembrane recepter protein [Acinetobacter boissieri]